MEKNGFKYGVVVDEEGYFVQAARWEVGKPRPQLNRKGQPRLWMLISDDAVKGAAPNGRWNKKRSCWDLPPKTYYVVNERGNIVSGSRQWASRLKPLAPNYEYVNKEPPKQTGRKPIWTGSEWVFPKRVGIVNAETNVIENIQVENPREDQPNVAITDGYYRIDDSDWPRDETGDEIGIGGVVNVQP